MNELLRLSRKLYLKKVPFVPKVLYWFNRFFFACDISYLVDIGENTVFSHSGLGVVVNDDAVIGKNCHILQNVTIGGRGGGKVPIIGDNVLLGAGCCILGEVRIGDGAKIGANAVVLQDVPAGTIAVGIPAVIKINKIKS